MDATSLAGKWTYRSFHNNPTPVAGDPAKALALIFAEAMFEFTAPSATSLVGILDWGSGGLDLSGTVVPATGGAPMTVSIVGNGRPGTQTAGWRYDYRAHDAYAWPNGVNQVQALVGSVIRVNPHGAAPAGYTASFIAVKRP